MEIKRKPLDDGWNAHLHIISEGKYLEQSKIKNLWHKITKDSYIVDIRKIKNDKHIIHYITKYISKGLQANISHNQDYLQEAILALRGTKLITTYGTWRKLKLREKPCVDLSDWEPIEKISEIIKSALRGNKEAAEILIILKGENHSWKKENPIPGPSP